MASHREAMAIPHEKPCRKHMTIGLPHSQQVSPRFVHSRTSILSTTSKTVSWLGDYSDKHDHFPMATTFRQHVRACQLYAQNDLDKATTRLMRPRPQLWAKNSKMSKVYRADECFVRCGFLTHSCTAWTLKRASELTEVQSRAMLVVDTGKSVCIQEHVLHSWH